MSNMDPQLAEMFNTNGFAEKVAEVKENVDIFLKFAEEEGIDLDGYTEEDIVQAANEMIGELRVQQEQYPDYDPEQPESAGNIGPKTAEADYIGRYIAHAMTNELENIKEAKMSLKGLQEAGKKGLSRYKELMSGGKYRTNPKHRSFRLTPKKEEFGAKGLLNKLKGADKAGKKKLLKEHGREAAKSLGAIGGTVASGSAVVGGGAAAMNKKSHLEYMEEAAVERANEIIQAAQEISDLTFDKVASVDENDFDRAITELAWAKLEEAGYIE